MSTAFECDVCGALVAGNDMIRCLHIDVSLSTDTNSDGRIEQGWNGIDTCQACSLQVLVSLQPALGDLESNVWPEFEAACALSQESGARYFAMFKAVEREAAELRQAVGLMTTLKPDLVMDALNPLKMMQEVHTYVTQERVEEPMHASAPEGYKCADCTMDHEACPTCYRAWWSKKHPHTRQV